MKATVEPMNGGKNLDVERLEQVADHLAAKLDEKDELAEDIKAIKSAGKALGFDMAAVEAIIKLKDPENLEKHRKKVDAMRTYGEIFGVEPF